jgi:hypothetical protein
LDTFYDYTANHPTSTVPCSRAMQVGDPQKRDSKEWLLPGLLFIRILLEFSVLTSTASRVPSGLTQLHRPPKLPSPRRNQTKLRLLEPNNNALETVFRKYSGLQVKLTNLFACCSALEKNRRKLHKYYGCLIDYRYSRRNEIKDHEHSCDRSSV